MNYKVFYWLIIPLLLVLASCSQQPAGELQPQLEQKSVGTCGASCNLAMKIKRIGTHELTLTSSTTPALGTTFLMLMPSGPRGTSVINPRVTFTWTSIIREHQGLSLTCRLTSSSLSNGMTTKIYECSN